MSLVRQLEEQLAPLGLTLGRLCLLYALQQHGSPALPSELGDDLAVTRANISGLLRGLERDGMVRRALDQADRRRVLVYFTPAGEDILNQAWPIYETTVSAMLQPLTTDEQMTLLRLLHKLNASQLAVNDD
ncbi:MarR family winged helix-turn-helix transcriptional regulator [Paenibacillus sp. OSY-SE]|uniref:MarR family winged helix-turn-helix transcriptional regulator n=1 Tax=Paenibacillus sp. OSY-SE TaxID=1196323 RepID=UPI0003161492|nr:MarR family transcriptional regulator [Paenibacillus sp. OSY-SE]